jgi:hypothetical protein
MPYDPTTNWDLLRPMDGEADSAEHMVELAEAVDAALISPTDKALLIGGNATTLHKHPSSGVTGLDAALSALAAADLTPTEKTDLTDGGGTVLHSHILRSNTGGQLDALEVLGTLKMGGQAHFDEFVDNGTVSTNTTKAINFTTGNRQKVTLSNSGTVTFTFTPPSGPCSVTLFVSHSTTAVSRMWSFPATVKWANGLVPTPSRTAGKADIISLLWDGTNFYTAASMNF